MVARGMMRTAVVWLAVGCAVMFTAWRWSLVLGDPHLWPAGGDLHEYQYATARWLSGGPFYEPWQSQPYVPADSSGAIMYPPIAIPLFVVAILLPEFAWWAIPIGLFAFTLARARPGPWRLATIVACLGIGATPNLVLAGNPVMWIAALLPYAPVLVLLKPTLAPFALVGVRRRSFWVGVGAILVSIPVLWPLWREWIGVVLNASGPRAGIVYSLGDVPIMLAGGLSAFPDVRARLPRWRPRGLLLADAGRPRPVDAPRGY